MAYSVYYSSLAPKQTDGASIHSIFVPEFDCSDGKSAFCVVMFPISTQLSDLWYLVSSA